MMNVPRCGVKDGGGGSSKNDHSRRKRYTLQGSRWRTRDLTYKINKYPSGLAKTKVDEAIAKAFQVWGDVSTLTFKQKTSGKVNIDISFERGKHGDGDAFDGPGGVLAHAFFPQYGGDAHFDAQEKWTVKTNRGTNLLQAAAHEFGHSLGLSHTSVKRALMAPFYRGYEPNLQLHSDDIKGIQALYGKKPTTTTTTTTRDFPRLPKNIDTVFIWSGNNKLYFVKDKKYWRYIKSRWSATRYSLSKGYPKAVKRWEGLQEGLDAATKYNGKTYFFKSSGLQGTQEPVSLGDDHNDNDDYVDYDQFDAVQTPHKFLKLLKSSSNSSKVPQKFLKLLKSSSNSSKVPH
ncbi:stromelysin-3-like [Homarus americanus]|uniref:stromelysin-3-like n=1 Tax=Homarus americanus TaxID=6706 RepID=UPI001C448027|nr:stromelysin-3-like [Homarus americanus]